MVEAFGQRYPLPSGHLPYHGQLPFDTRMVEHKFV
jgi:hypothetical protein